jgi:hypothetical protein
MPRSLFTIDIIATIMCDFQNPLFQFLEPFADMLRDRLAIRNPLQFSSRLRSFQSPGFPGPSIGSQGICPDRYEARSR